VRQGILPLSNNFAVELLRSTVLPEVYFLKSWVGLKGACKIGNYITSNHLGARPDTDLAIAKQVDWIVV